MPVITIEWYKGRSKTQKAELAKRITDDMVEVGKTSAEHVHIVFKDVAKEDWAIGGILSSEQ